MACMIWPYHTHQFLKTRALQNCPSDQYTVLSSSILTEKIDIVWLLPTLLFKTNSEAQKPQITEQNVSNLNSIKQCIMPILPSLSYTYMHLERTEKPCFKLP